MAGLLDYLPGYTRSQADFNRRVGQPLSSNLLEFIEGAPVVGGITRAVENPTLGSVSNAGIESLLAAGKPLAAMRLLAGAYGAAGAKDMGLLDGVSSAQAKRDKKPTPMADLPGLTPEQNRELGEAKARLKTSDYESRRDADALAATVSRLEGLSADYIRGKNATEVEAAAAKARSQQDEYDRATQKAEATKAKLLQRDRNFDDSAIADVYDKTAGFTPFLGGMAGGALYRAVKGAPKTAWQEWGAPAVAGIGFGEAAAHAPTWYNAHRTPADNPLIPAYEAYSRELPAGHPSKGEAQKIADDMRTKQPTNPIHDAAQAEFYDPWKLAERTFSGIWQGALGGKAGGLMAGLPKAAVEGLASVPGQFERAYLEARPALPGAGQNTPATPGNAPPPGGGLLPPAAPSSPQALPPPPAPGAQGSPRAVRYGKAQQNVARALVDSDVGVGGSVPSANALENAYRTAGVKMPTSKKYGDMVNDTQKLVAEMQAKGMAPSEIVKTLKALRENGTPILGIGAAGALAAPGLLDFGDSP